MLDRGYGRIINISSVIGEKGNIGQANYAAAKSGLFGLTNSLALETARKGITVNSVAPGSSPPRWSRPCPRTSSTGDRHHPGRAAGRAGRGRPGGRVLADPDSGYITGEIIDINGGLYM